MLCQVVQFVLLLLLQLLLLLLPHSCQMTVSDSFCALPLFRHLSLALSLALLPPPPLVFWQRPFARRSSANNKHKQFIVGAANKSEKRLIKLRTQVQHIKYTFILCQPALPVSLSTFSRLPTPSAAALPCPALICPDVPWTVIVDRCLTLNC